jgi:hypothetical protein
MIEHPDSAGLPSAAPDWMHKAEANQWKRVIFRLQKSSIYPGESNADPHWLNPGSAHASIQYERLLDASDKKVARDKIPDTCVADAAQVSF